MADHRKLARDMDLFHFEEHSPGMGFWHPHGLRLFRRIEDLMRHVYQGHGFEEVRSPLSTQTTMQLKHHKLWPWAKTPFTYCALTIGRTRHEFGGFLTVAENQWLCKAINTFLDDQRS